MLPRSLLWRTFLLVGLVVLVAVAAAFRIYTAYEREPRARQLAQLGVSVVNLTRAALISAQPEKRRELLLQLSYQEGIQVYPAERDDRITALPDEPLMALLQEEVRRALGPETRLAQAVDGQSAFWISFAIYGDEYWVALPPERLERRFPTDWIGWVGAVLLLSLAAAYLIASRVAKPLQAVAAAAAQVGRGTQPQPLSERGVREIASVARAVNQMARDLQRLDEDRALILAGISHDLRTPLTRLRLGLEVAGVDPALQEDMSADIEEMDRIIGQFLDFARDTGGEPFHETDLDALAAEVVEGYRRRGEPVSFAPGGLAPLAVRPMAVRRLLANLVDNSLRYGAGAPVEVAVRSEAGCAVLAVRDRGPGIPADQVERLKRPFTRLTEARSGVSGSGLGLAIVERICRSHGGRLELGANPGGGLLAGAHLPLRTGPRSPGAPPKPARGDGAPSAAGR